MAVPQEDSTTLDTKHPSKGHKVAFAKLLAGNDKKIRDKGLKKLKKWLSVRSMGNYEFTESDVMTIWVGLFYSMWMSDMPLVQEELAESLSSLVHCFNNNNDAALLFIKCFNMTMNKTWGTLDQYRIDKFSMLVRRFLRQSLLWLAGHGWHVADIRKLMRIYAEQVLAENAALGFKLHFIEIFPEELAKVTKGELSQAAVVAFVAPFVRAAASTRDGRVRLQLGTFFQHLMKQTDVALEYEEKFQAWRQAGFPGGNVNLMVPDSDDDEDGDEAEDGRGKRGEGNGEEAEDGRKNIEGNGSPLDPRAGSVHVMLPQIQLPVRRIVKLLKKQTMAPEATIKGKRLMITLSRQFRKLSKEKYPFAFRQIDDEKLNLKKMVDEAAKKMIKSDARRKNKKSTKKKLNRGKKAAQNKEEESKSAKAPKTKLKPDAPKTKEQSSPSKHQKAAVLTNQISTVRKRKASAAFVVSKVPETPVDTDSTDLELPPGWIVDGCEDTPRPKKRAPMFWDVKLAKNGSATHEATLAEEEKERKKKKKVENVLVTPPNGSHPKEKGVVKENNGLVTPEKKTNPKRITPIRVSSEVTSVIEGTSHVGESVLTCLPAKENSPKGKSTVKSLNRKDPSSGKENSPQAVEPSTSDGEQRMETETTGEVEIVIENKRKSPPAFFARAFEKAGVSPKTPNIHCKVAEASSESKNSRRISFNLARNMAQEKVEYFQQVQRSPQIPFDGARQPRQSALKAGLPPSPINPFYARKLKLQDSFS